VGESLTLAGGFAIIPLEIDVDGGEAWFSITQDGEEVDSSVAKEMAEYKYEADLNDSGDDDNWVLKFKVDTVFAGMNTNLVKINSTQLISPDVLLVETPDDDTFSNFEITSENSDTTLQIKLDQTDDEIGLKKDGIVSFLNDRFNFKINEDGDVGGVLKVVEVGGPNVTATATVEPVDAPIGNETETAPGVTGTATGEATTVAETPVATETETEEEPGFEAVFAIAGLLAVAYLVLRKRE